MSDALSSVGQHCAFCKELDFLPIKCSFCSSILCKNHIQPEQHQCPSDPSLNRVDPVASTSQNTFASLLPDRSLPLQTPVAEKNAEARRLLAQNFPPKAKVAAAPKKPLNPKLALMLLRQKATCPDLKKKAGDVAMPDRLYFYASEGDGTSKPFWLPKTTSVGRALDLLAAALDVRNVNDTAKEDLQRLYLYRQQGDERVKVEPSSATLGQSGLPDRSEIVIVRGGLS